MNLVAFLVALVLFIGGLALMGYAFTFEGFEGPTFVAGILAVSAALALPVHVLKRVDG
ncbi:MAG: hypothetical protein ABUL47_06580 [Leifsonia sp.]